MCIYIYTCIKKCLKADKPTYMYMYILCIYMYVCIYIYIYTLTLKFVHIGSTTIQKAQDTRISRKYKTNTWLHAYKHGQLEEAQRECALSHIQINKRMLTYKQAQI